MDPAIAVLLDRYPVTEAAAEFLTHAPGHYVGGARQTGTGQSLPIFEPSTGGRLSVSPDAKSSEVAAAVDAARAALGPWASTKPNERQAVLLRLADLVEAHAQTLAEIETVNNGKALEPCLAIDVLGSADLLRYMAGFATKIEGATRSVSAPGRHLAMTVKEPVGVVAGIVPWNWPLSMACWKLAAPLAAGCTVVLKPDHKTPFSLLYLAQLSEAAGLPPGVLNIILGQGATAGASLIAHPDVNKISFTGSTETGRLVGAAAGKALKPATLELGGKSPMIMFEDADPAAVAEACRWSVFFNAGQVCSSGTRLYVHRSRYDDAVQALRQTAESLRLRPGLDPECDMGPVISAEQRSRILDIVGKGIDAGARVVTGGKAFDAPGWFVEPTVLATDNNEAAIVQEEIFGPVLVMLPFDDEADVVRSANASHYGLGASVWTRDLDRALRTAEALEAGTVWINAHDLVDSALPFGGFKSSGHGKDLGPEQFEACLKTKTMWLAYN